VEALALSASIGIPVRGAWAARAETENALTPPTEAAGSRHPTTKMKHHLTSRRPGNPARRSPGHAALAVLAVIAACCAGPKRLAAIDFEYVKIFDTNTAIPGGTGNFTGFDGYPSLNGDRVASLGGGVSDSSYGVYTDAGGALHAVADRGTPIPGGTGNFTFFDSPSLDGDNIAFSAYNDDFSQQGVFTNAGGSLHVVADRNTPIPGGTGNFTSLDGVSLDAGSVAFRGFGSGSQRGIYTDAGGTLHAVANTSTPNPSGTGNFTSFGNPSLDGGNVAFRGLGGGSQGIYTDAGGALRAVASTSTAIPGGTGNFTDFGIETPSLDGGDVAFVGNGFSGQQGIYTDAGGALRVVADKSTAIPSGTGNFIELRLPSMDSGNVAFVGYGASSQRGIYTDLGGALSRVVAHGQTLDGKEISSVFAGPEALSDSNIAFYVEFSDSSKGIYAAVSRYSYTATGNGLFDSAANWSFGLSPRAVVPTVITPQSGLVVTGPAAPTTLRALILGSEVSGTAVLNLQSGGALSLNEGLAVLARGSLVVKGALAVLGAAANAGEITIASGAAATFSGDFLQNGILSVEKFGAASGMATFFGDFSGTGGASGGGDIVFRANVSPGAGPAAITFSNSILLGNSATLWIELGGVTGGAQFDVFNVTQQLNLNGMLQVVFINDFAPAAGDSFDILNWGSLNGTFNTVNLPALSDGLAWDLSALYTNGTLTVVVPEPATLGLLAFAGCLAALAAWQAARRRTAAARRNLFVCSLERSK
jgi:hypothetical protein